jgi:hypothetical protein
MKKKWIWIVIILILLTGIILLMLFNIDSVGAVSSAEPSEVAGRFREISVWFELLVTFLVTVGGFFLAMQFDGILEKITEAEKEDEVWTISIEQSLKEIRKKVFKDAAIIRLINSCDAMLRACEIDSIAISTIRKSPFYRRLYFILTELHTLPIEKSDLLFSKLSDFKEIKTSGTELQKQIIGAIYTWLITIVLLDSIDFSKHKLYEDTRISMRIKDELDTYFCFEEYVNDSKKIKAEGYKILKQVDANLPNIEYYLNEEAKQFCSFLKSNDGKSSLVSKKEIIKKIYA